MPTKKQNVISKSAKIWRLLFILLLLTVIVGGVLLLNSYLNQQAEQKEKAADDIKFAKIETYINQVKATLDQEIPEGKWKIQKNCQEPGTKGDFDEYSCRYGVNSDSKESYKERLLSVASLFSAKELYVSESGVTYGLYVDFDDAGCSAYYERDAVNISGFRCSSGSHKLRYPLQ